MKLLGIYKNGNYTVSLFDEGTKIRRNDLDNFTPEFPECIDFKITDYCDMNCPFCFTENTQILLLNNAHKPIKEVDTNDVVLSFNKNSGKIEYKRVLKTYKRKYTGKLIIIEFNDKKIKCTPNHKIYTKNRGIIEAQYLNDDDILVSV